MKMSMRGWWEFNVYFWRKFHVKMDSFEFHIKMKWILGICRDWDRFCLLFYICTFYVHLYCNYLQSVGVRHSAKPARILAANVLPRSSVITSMGAVSPAVTGDIKESSAPKVVHLQTKSNAPRVVHLHLHILSLCRMWLGLPRLQL